MTSVGYLLITELVFNLWKIDQINIFLQKFGDSNISPNVNLKFLTRSQVKNCVLYYNKGYFIHFEFCKDQCLLELLDKYL